MRKALFAVFLLLFLGSASAVKVRSHSIEVSIEDNGSASVIERYAIEFESVLDVDEFQENKQRNSSGLAAWKADYPFFFPQFGEIAGNKLERSFVSYDEESNTLTLEYRLREAFPSLLADEPRTTSWSISSAQLSAFQKENLIVIPENTSIEFNLPSTAEVSEPSLPAGASLVGKTIVLRGLTTSHLDMKYSVQKPIVQTVNSIQLIQEFISNSSNLALIVVGFIVIGIVFLKRKELSERIETYIVEHSELEHQKPEEEIELEV
ncbi:MAG: hypothetical protein J4224_04185 [Candidatus Diapherotrites archaeon]|uniref:Uncharacterized protein n=1 Tax=Candidatus Iainarchaeum sp. TaxID=3101447 RepID=A0A7J4ITM7_9ARCH|nr:MAG: hypothetical protein QT03_C0001G1260 [archaeon GW2011_AR10]MBS3059594.1 hypothetical protein [Candidatus Diapherotrites archaeon]HIH08124.1 hypothetical protein [Candidatus Diapherotrites archaeon]